MRIYRNESRVPSLQLLIARPQSENLHLEGINNFPVSRLQYSFFDPYRCLVHTRYLTMCFIYIQLSKVITLLSLREWKDADRELTTSVKNASAYHVISIHSSPCICGSKSPPVGIFADFDLLRILNSIKHTTSSTQENHIHAVVNHYPLASGIQT